jgi:hypothetical protein
MIKIVFRNGKKAEFKGCVYEYENKVVRILKPANEKYRGEGDDYKLVKLYPLDTIKEIESNQREYR